MRSDGVISLFAALFSASRHKKYCHKTGEPEGKHGSPLVCETIAVCIKSEIFDSLVLHLIATTSRNNVPMTP